MTPQDRINSYLEKLDGARNAYEAAHLDWRLQKAPEGVSRRISTNHQQPDGGEKSHRRPDGGKGTLRAEHPTAESADLSWREK
jgi:hypothetical protein